MKTILTTLFAVIATISINAQGKFDTAIQPSLRASGYKTTSISTEPTSNYNRHDADKKGITILPNAVTNDVKIIFKTNKVAAGSILVLDETGKKVLEQDAKIEAGNNKININDFHKLTEGTYTIKLTSNNETYTSSFMIWK